MIFSDFEQLKVAFNTAPASFSTQPTFHHQQQQHLHGSNENVFQLQNKLFNSHIGLLFGASYKSEKKFKIQIGVRPLSNTKRRTDLGPVQHLNYPLHK